MSTYTHTHDTRHVCNYKTKQDLATIMKYTETNILKNYTKRRRWSTEWKVTWFDSWSGNRDDACMQAISLIVLQLPGVIILAV